MRWLRAMWRRWQGLCPRCGSITFIKCTLESVPGGFDVCGERCGWRRLIR
jgi:uncharacterized protein (DUF983 family)